MADRNANTKSKKTYLVIKSTAKRKAVQSKKTHANFKNGLQSSEITATKKRTARNKKHAANNEKCHKQSGDAKQENTCQ